MAFPVVFEHPGLQNIGLRLYYLAPLVLDHAEGAEPQLGVQSYQVGCSLFGGHLVPLPAFGLCLSTRDLFPTLFGVGLGLGLALLGIREVLFSYFGHGYPRIPAVPIGWSI